MFVIRKSDGTIWLTRNLQEHFSEKDEVLDNVILETTALKIALGHANKSIEKLQPANELVEILRKENMDLKDAYQEAIKKLADITKPDEAVV